MIEVHFNNTEMKRDLRIPCSNCSHETNHRIMTGLQRTAINHDSEIEEWNDYVIVRCLGCDEVSFLLQRRDSMESSHGVDHLDFTSHTFLYPSRIAGRVPMGKTWFLPDNIRSVYFEAHAALSNRLSILAAIGIRAVIEGLCIDKSVPGANLKKKVEALAREGLVTEEGAAILQKLRLLGNAAAHEIKKHSEFEMGAAFDIVEHLLMGVYILPQQSERIAGNGDG